MYTYEEFKEIIRTKQPVDYDKVRGSDWFRAVRDNVLSTCRFHGILYEVHFFKPTFNLYTHTQIITDERCPTLEETQHIMLQITYDWREDDHILVEIDGEIYDTIIEVLETDE